MENNPNSDQNTDQLLSNDDDIHDQYNLSTVHINSQSSSARSYECIFCKRGFTNAQALGGHMNIHRKHKAKLKQSAHFSSTHETKQQQQTSEIPKNIIMAIKPSYSSPNLPIVMSNSNLEGSDYYSVTNPSDHNIVDDHENIVTTTNWFLNQESPTSDDHDRDDQRGLLSSDGRGSSSTEDPELDLELRLGPEPPQDSSSTAAATRKFF